MRILTTLHRFAEIGEGDVKKLQGDSEELRLRVGDYRVRFTEEPHDTLIIHSVRHRSEAYRLTRTLIGQPRRWPPDGSRSGTPVLLRTEEQTCSS